MISVTSRMTYNVNTQARVSTSEPTLSYRRALGIPSPPLPRSFSPFAFDVEESERMGAPKTSASWTILENLQLAGRATSWDDTLTSPYVAQFMRR